MQRGSAVKSGFRNSLVGLACVVVLSGCATATGPVRVDSLPETAGGAKSASVSQQDQQAPEKKIGDALDQMRNLVESVQPGLLGMRSQVVSRHNFSQGVPLKELFASNGFFVRFDPVSLGHRPTEAPLFIGTVGDLISYLEDVLGLYVRVEEAGTFIVSECKEIAYDAPADAADFFRPMDLARIMSHPDARVSYFKVGKLYAYDDRAGHRRIAEYVQAVERSIRRSREVQTVSGGGISWSSSKARDKVLERLDEIERRLAVLDRRLDDKALDMQLADLRARVVALERRPVESISTTMQAKPVVSVERRMQTEVAHKVRKDPPVSQEAAESQGVSSSGLMVYAGSFRSEAQAKAHQAHLAKRLGKEPAVFLASNGWYAVYYRVESESAGKELMDRLKENGVPSPYMRFEKR